MIPLHLARLCCSCDLVYHGNAGPRCPACDSAAVYYIARWLNRAEKPSAKEQAHA